MQVTHYNGDWKTVALDQLQHWLHGLRQLTSLLGSSLFLSVKWTCSVLFTDLWGIRVLVHIRVAPLNRRKLFLWRQYRPRACYFILLSNSLLGVLSFMQVKRIHFITGAVIGTWHCAHVTLQRASPFVDSSFLILFPTLIMSHHVIHRKGTWLIFLETNQQRIWWSQPFVKMHILGHWAWCFLGHLLFCNKEKSQCWLPKLSDPIAQDFLIELFSNAKSCLHFCPHMCFPQRWWTRRHDVLQWHDTLLWAASLRPDTR